MSSCLHQRCRSSPLEPHGCVVSRLLLMLGVPSMLRLMIGRGLFARPRFRNRPPPGYVVHDKNQLVIVIAVEYLDVDTRLGHPSRDLAELTRFSLVQSLD